MAGSIIMVVVTVLLFVAGRMSSRGVALQGSVELQEEVVVAERSEPGEVFVV
jgi:hypothetical protein